MADISKCTGGSYSISTGKGIYTYFVEFYFVDFFVTRGQGCPQILVILYWLGGLVLPSEYLKLTKLQNKKFVSHMC
jgi:hypothetical protein